MRILLAFDKFKDALTARQVCEVAHTVFQQHLPDSLVDSAPLTDGGEGFCEILTTASSGRFEALEARNPLGESLTVEVGFVQAEELTPETRKVGDLPMRGEIAVIEMAAASGLHLLSENNRDARETTTHGVGDMMARAIEKRVDAILLGIGGSATNDLGLGALQALGIRFLDGSGRLLDRVKPSLWNRIARIDGDLLELPPVRIACDVENSLLGASGATFVYGPQKGIPKSNLADVEREFGEIAGLLLQAFLGKPALLAEPGAGAAGGLGFGLRTVTGSRFVPGFPLVSAWLDLDRRIAESDLVITGEGCFDDSSLRGKGPGTVAAMADRMGKPVLLLAGSMDPLTVEKLCRKHPKVEARSISRRDLSLDANLRRTSQMLTKVLQEVIETRNWEWS